MTEGIRSPKQEATSVDKAKSLILSSEEYRDR